MKPLSLLLVVLFWPVAGIAAEDADPKQSEQAEREAANRRGAIRDEIKALGDHPWAGEYYEGDGLGMNVSLFIAPKGGYVFGRGGCVGPYGQDYGEVVPNDGRLRLSSRFPNRLESFPGIAEEFGAVRWGNRKYLVPFNDNIGFCNLVNAGDEPRSSMNGKVLLRRGDEHKKVEGFPTVPPKYKPYLLARPIEAEIVEVGKVTMRPSQGDRPFRDTPVTLNAGKKAGLLPGMELHVVQPKDVYESVTIRKVEDDRSEAVMTQVGLWRSSGPKAGWKLSTRYSWNR